MMSWLGNGGYGMGHGFGGFAMMLFWVVIIVVGIWAVKSVSSRTSENNSPEDILKKRYAKGERNMQTKKRMWLLIIASIFLTTACSQNEAPAESLVGMKAPAFQLDDARGGQVSLSDYIQQQTPVLLFFHMAVG
jgi:hypothetical protein